MNPNDEATPSVDPHHTVSTSHFGHDPRTYRYGGWVLVGLIALGVLIIWLLVADIVGSRWTLNEPDAAVYALIAMSWGMLLVDWPGYTTFNGHTHWNVMSGGRKFWLVCAFLFLPEFTLAAYLWWAARDHLAAIRTTPKQQAKVQWERFKASSIGIKGAIAASLVVAAFIISGLSAASYIHGSAEYVALVGPSPTASSVSIQTEPTLAPLTATLPPLATMTPIPTLAPTPTFTPAPTATPAPIGPAQVGGTVDDFVAKYGQPINPGTTGSLNFYGDSGQTIFIGIDVVNGAVVHVSLTTDSSLSWDDVQTYNYCSQFLPIDAVLFNRDGQKYDYNSGLGEVVLDETFGPGQCNIYEPSLY